MYSRLGDAIHVHQTWLLISVAIEPWPQALHLQCLAAKNHVAQGQFLLTGRLFGLDELPERRGCLVQHCDLFFGQKFVKRLR